MSIIEIIINGNLEYMLSKQKKLDLQGPHLLLSKLPLGVKELMLRRSLFTTFIFSVLFFRFSLKISCKISFTVLAS